MKRAILAVVIVLSALAALRVFGVFTFAVLSAQPVDTDPALEWPRVRVYVGATQSVHKPGASRAVGESNQCLRLLETDGRQDVPTRVDFDGNLRGDDNWESLPRFALPPTVYYAAFHTAQFWDGRAADVEEQAKGPALHRGLARHGHLDGV